MTLTERAHIDARSAWLEANRAHVETQLHRLRLLLRRRVLWLRHQWQDDSAQPYRGMAITDSEAERLLAGEDRWAEWKFYEEDPQARAVSRSIEAVERELFERAPTAPETPPALEVLVQLFDLSNVERDVLLLSAAPSLDPTLERLYAYVQDDLRRTCATPHLAVSLFANAASERRPEWEIFLPGAPLRHYHLVSLEHEPAPGTPLGVRPLIVDERIADYLSGIDRLDENVTSLLRPMPQAFLTREHEELVSQVAAALHSAGDGPWPVVNLTGAEGAGHRVIAESLCERLGFRLFTLAADRLPPPGPEREDLLGRLERDAALSSIALYLDAFGIGAAEAGIVSTLEDVIERLGVFLLLGSRERWDAERETVVVPIRKPGPIGQCGLWHRALAGDDHLLDEGIEALAEQFDLGPEEIGRAVASARHIARLRAPTDGADVTLGDLWKAAREQSTGHLDELAQRITPCYTWGDIVLPADVRAQLAEVAAQVAGRPQVYERWGFGAKLSRGRGISALFSGPSGTGKTMAAEILANHLNLDLYRIDLAGVVSKYIGETEKNLKKVFTAAEQSGAILFFDEADALFGKRTEVKDSHDRYANIEVNYLLQRMEDYRGLAILATNRKSILDRAFMRRLRFLVDFPFPDASNRLRIWQSVFPAEAELDELDYTALSRLAISGGNIRNIALNAAFLAADEGASIGMKHVLHAARREYNKIDKLITKAEFGAACNEVKP